MLRENELNMLLKHLSVTQEGKRYIKIARTSPPSRLPSRGFSNIVDIIASRKMGVTIKSESRHVELPFLFNQEFDSSVLEFYDQPPAIKLEYQVNGRNRSHLYTPDFLTIENSCIYLTECKPEKKLGEEAKKRPYLYTQNGKGWVCPPAQAAAAKLGITHCVVSDSDFKPIFTRNCNFLFNFIDDKPLDRSYLNDAAGWVEAQAGRVNLKHFFETFSQSALVQLILARRLHFDLQRDLFILPDNAWVYFNKANFDVICELRSQHQVVPAKSIEELQNQSIVFWGSEQWDVLNVAGGLRPTVSLRNHDKVVHLKYKELITLFDENLLLIALRSDRDVAIENKILNARTKDVEEAQERLRLIQKAEHGHIDPIKARSIRRWRGAYRQAEEELGCGFLGLIGNRPNCGDRSCNLTEMQLSLLEQAIELYKTKKAPSAYSAFAYYKNLSGDAGEEAISLTTFYDHINKNPKTALLLARRGKRAAVAYAPAPRTLDLDKDLPAHGDFIFEIAHADHTPIEMTFRSELDDEPIKSLWLSVLIDSYSRMILAFYLSFETPSYRTLMMLLRECYRRHGRIPWYIVCDGGKEFRSGYFEKLIARLGSHIRHRANDEPRSGSIMERVLGVSETTLIHTLEGNRSGQKLGRGQSSTHNPAKRALWTVGVFYLTFKDWAYVTHPHLEHGGIREKPFTRFERSRSNFDVLPGCQVECSDDFYLQTLPDAKNGLTLRKNQTKFRGITYRLSKSMDGYSGGKLKVEARYDPYDLTYILCCVRDKWVKCFTSDTLVRECKERGIQMAHLEVYPRQTRHNHRYRNVPEAALIAQRKVAQTEQLLFTQKQVQDMAPISEMPLSEEHPSIDLSTVIAAPLIDNGEV